ncbi:MAG: UvrD-helicase domain-containing protein [Clostridia bacterium]|nr:UvrD-helicase domain-containing protein [Clostridia bacterium]
MDLRTLNDMQRKAVTTTEGALLVLAGAGSGKTRVLTYRIAYMIKECGISPYSILALTFTNKAAREMKERTEQLLGTNARDMWVSTFHSACARILRIDGEKLGIDNNFTIYDDAERKAIIAPVMSRLNLDEKQLGKAAVLHMISDAKNHSVDPLDFLSKEYPQFGDVILTLYKEYEKGMRTANALDFDDLIVMVIRLLSGYPDMLEKYRRKFRYVLIDEYQDTNMPQYELIRLLCEEHGNICAVGDDDQSIYGWRGADIRNILEFEKDFPGAEVIRLEQNYRSTGNILDAATAVIENNINRNGKRLWTAEGSGDKIVHNTVYDEREEADFICKTISAATDRGASYRDHAVLYRTNAQSRVIESALISYGIKYRVLGGQNFYDRMEVKYIMSYLRLIANPNDNAAFKRIINVPKRGVGDKSVEILEEYAYGYGMSMMQLLLKEELFSTLTGAMQKKFSPFVELYKNLCEIRREGSASVLVQSVIDDTGYMDYLSGYDGEFESRSQNVEELIEVVTEVEEGLDDESDALLIFLENAALATDMDEGDEDSTNYVSIMTLHSAKGLEYHTVFVTGMEEGLFPTTRSLDDFSKLEEERRLCYVGITRAMRKLYLTNAQNRRQYNNFMVCRPSRFLEEIPCHLMKETGKAKREYVFSGADVFSSTKPSLGRVVTKPAYEVEKKRTTPSPGSVSTPPKPTVNAEAANLDVGMRVNHAKFGNGTITQKSGSGNSAILTVEFENGEVKKLAASFAPLRRID